MGLAEGDAWEAVGHAAEIDRAEASEERGDPWTSVGGSWSRDLGGIGEDGIEPLGPIRDIFLVDGAWLGTRRDGCNVLLLLLCVHLGLDEDRREIRVSPKNRRL